MKTILEFNLPEDEVEASYAINASKLYSALISYNQRLRNIAKHSDDEIEAKQAIWAREILFDELGVLTEIYEL